MLGDLADRFAVKIHLWQQEQGPFNVYRHFSKYAWTLPLKLKTGSALIKSFSFFLTDTHVAHNYTNEWIYKQQNFLTKPLDSCYAGMQSFSKRRRNADTNVTSVAEWFNCTRKTNMRKCFTLYKNNHRVRRTVYVDVFLDLVPDCTHIITRKV